MIQYLSINSSSLCCTCCLLPLCSQLLCCLHSTQSELCPLQPGSVCLCANLVSLQPWLLASLASPISHVLSKHVLTLKWAHPLGWGSVSEAICCPGEAGPSPCPTYVWD